MHILRTPREAQAAILTAELIARELVLNPCLVLGLATGRTMELVYAQLVRLHREKGLDFSRCRTFNLDEYVGLPPSHPGSYHHYMEERLFRPVNLQREQVALPDGMAPDLPAECRRYEALIQKAGGIDLLLLGLGQTGHIGFNEPPTPFDSRTHEARLLLLTRKQNADRFGGNVRAVPATALTMGIGTILEARRCLVLVTGAKKAAILAKVLEGPVTPLVPGSALQRHPDCQVVVDEAAVAQVHQAGGPGGN
ncbi:MAG TPA: glucosamine-6-phosphate deaminase [Geothrix sp.]